MNIFAVLFSNPYINVGFVAWLSAQVLKTLLTLLVTRELVWERMVGAGGMPSAHSALVCSVAAMLERKLGFASPEFALALVLAAIVMYDAMGVRRAAGQQAKVLNVMIENMSLNLQELFTDPKHSRLYRLFHREKHAEEITQEDEEREALLKEFLGHTPLEVLAGAVLGISIGMLMPL